MINDGLALWEALLIGLGCMVLGIAVFCLVVKITNWKRRIPQHATTPMEDHNQGMGFQYVREHAEKSLERISSTVNNELIILKKLMEKEDVSNQMNGSSIRIKRSAQRNLKKSNEVPWMRSDVVRDKYGEVKKLVDLGMSVKKISERVRIPQGEIVLVKKLKEGVVPNHGGSPARGGGLT